jgi:hypothetical protein
MGAKPCPRGNSILVDDPQRPEFDVPGVEIIRERKAVIRIEPAMIGMAALIAPPDCIHVDLLLQPLWGLTIGLKGVNSIPYGRIGWDAARQARRNRCARDQRLGDDRKNGVPREGDLLEQAVPVVAPPDCACLKLSCRSFHGRRSQERIASTQQRFE